MNHLHGGEFMRQRSFTKKLTFMMALSLLLILSPLVSFADSENDSTELPTTGFEDRDSDGWTTLEEELEFMQELAEKSERVSFTEEGTSVEGRPIYLVRVGYPTPPADDDIAKGRNILIMGTPHGNEPAGREMTLKMMRDLAFTDDEDLLELMTKSTILFVPTPNPDGRFANTRGNAWGIDNNRDHLNLNTPEMQTVARILNKYSPDITVDAHERPSGSNPDMEMLWPRNLNVDEELRALNIEMVQDYLLPDVEEAGFTTGLYGTPGGAGGGDERILRNTGGLRHGLSLLTESAGRAEPVDRVDMQMETAKSVLRFYQERFADVVNVVNSAPLRKATEGKDSSIPFYLDGADNWDPTNILETKPLGYLLNTSQAKQISRHIDAFSLKTEKVSEHGVFVTMNQPGMTVIPLLLDQRASHNEVDGLPLYDITNPGSVEPPLGFPSVTNLQILVDRYEADGAFANDPTVRLHKNHLTTVSLYDDKESADKAIKHLKSYLVLLDHQNDQGLISEEAYNHLASQADRLLKEWEHEFYHDFSGDDGDSWDTSAFVSLDSWPSNPAGATYRIQENTGQIILDERLQGNGSAYGRVTPVMEDLDDSELLVRFRADSLGNNQRLRLYLQADRFSSGSTMPVNGYGIELHLGNDELILQGRADSSSTTFEKMDANMTTDWHWIRLRVQGDELAVRMWNDHDEEPDEWDIAHNIASNEKLTGKVLLSFINFDYDTRNTFYLDEIIINDLSK